MASDAEIKVELKRLLDRLIHKSVHLLLNEKPEVAPVVGDDLSPTHNIN